MKEQNEKQAVEEMAALMDGACDVIPLGECYTVDCNKCKAALLYNAGYRKQINAKWKSGTKNGQFGYYCTNCDAGFTVENAEWIAKEHDFCPKCGAMMKGAKQ